MEREHRATRVVVMTVETGDKLNMEREHRATLVVVLGDTEDVPEPRQIRE
jgi:hypothetical protein